VLRKIKINFVTSHMTKQPLVILIRLMEACYPAHVISPYVGEWGVHHNLFIGDDFRKDRVVAEDITCLEKLGK